MWGWELKEGVDCGEGAVSLLACALPDFGINQSF